MMTVARWKFTQVRVNHQNVNDITAEGELFSRPL